MLLHSYTTVRRAFHHPHRENPDATEFENTLHVWIRTQEAKSSTGNITLARQVVLDETVPAWNRSKNSVSTTS